METEDAFINYDGKAGCVISEEQFPLMAKCCDCRCEGILRVYKSACSYFNVSILPPDGLTLQITVIIKCRRNGYCRRVKENAEL